MIMSSCVAWGVLAFLLVGLLATAQQVVAGGVAVAWTLSKEELPT